MYHFKALFAGVVIVFGLALAGDRLAGQTDPGKNDDKKAVNVFLKHVQVSTTNRNGNSWDIDNGKPDLVVRIKNLSDNTIKEWASQEKSDTFEATFDIATILATEGQNIQIEVVDNDIVANDAIGTTSFRLTSDMLKKGSHEMSFDLVKSLTLEFRNP